MRSFSLLRSIACVLLVYIGNVVPVQAFCYISIQDILFGEYDAAQVVPKTTTAEYTLECRKPVVLTLEIRSPGTPTGGNYRKMHHASGKDSLAYNLFSDSTMTRIWGDGRHSPAPVVRVEGRHSSFIYGQVFAGQDVWPGEYDDTIRLIVLP